MPAKEGGVVIVVIAVVVVVVVVVISVIVVNFLLGPDDVVERGNHFRLFIRGAEIRVRRVHGQTNLLLLKKKRRRPIRLVSQSATYNSAG